MRGEKAMGERGDMEKIGPLRGANPWRGEALNTEVGVKEKGVKKSRWNTKSL